MPKKRRKVEDDQQELRKKFLDLLEEFREHDRQRDDHIAEARQLQAYLRRKYGLR